MAYCGPHFSDLWPKEEAATFLLGPPQTAPCQLLPPALTPPDPPTRPRTAPDTAAAALRPVLRPQGGLPEAHISLTKHIVKNVTYSVFLVLSLRCTRPRKPHLTP